MKTSKLIKRLKEPATLRLTRMAQNLKAQGKPVIHLGAGEPKSKMPPSVIEASVAKIQSGEMRYTPARGTPDLISAVIAYTRENYDRVPTPENVIVTTGAKQSFYTLMMTIVDPGDEVIILAPYWVSYPDIVKVCGGDPIVVSPQEGSFIPAWDDIQSKVNGNTRAIVVNSPNNPSGAIYPSELISRLVTFCEERDIYLVMDDIYHKLAFDEHSSVNCYEYTDKPINESHLVVLNGVSKLYAMTGFRIGWTIASNEIISGMVNLVSQNYSCPSEINQVAATAALRGDQSCVKTLRSILAKNCSLMAKELSTISYVTLREPQGTFYCFPDFSHYDKSSGHLAAMLLEKALVVAVPGIEFGMEGYLRLSVCSSPEEIREGIARIRWALDPDSPEEMQLGDTLVKRDWALTI